MVPSAAVPGLGAAAGALILAVPRRTSALLNTLCDPALATARTAGASVPLLSLVCLKLYCSISPKCVKFSRLCGPFLIEIHTEV